ncbi:MAG: hypothetical protein KAW67_00090 [Candidatus Eisenbacteria sp.]|nr:hypothetical protein [Candidatus Eisenbacteria bacterium]
MNPASGPLLLEPELAELVRSLRSESDALKECFTKYSFQAIAMSVAILGIVVRFVWANPATALISIAAGFIILMTRRIGTYKYAAANRLTAYELHLYRTRNTPPHLRGRRWKPYMRYIGWEEAMRAWRLVHATLFEEVYVSRRFWPNFHRKPYRGRRRPFWFRQQSMLGGRPSVVWHPESYLRTLMLLLKILAWAVVACLFLMTHQVYDMGLGIWWIRGSWAVTIAMTVVTVLRLLMDDKRRHILEDELLSISSCSVVWQAVVIAHYSALDRARSVELATEDMKKLPVYAPSLQNPQSKLPDGSGFKGYTYWLADEAQSLARSAEDIDGWIAG